jgi:hypothetical protein
MSCAGVLKRRFLRSDAISVSRVDDHYDAPGRGRSLRGFRCHSRDDGRQPRRRLSLVADVPDDEKIKTINLSPGRDQKTRWRPLAVPLREARLVPWSLRGSMLHWV